MFYVDALFALVVALLVTLFFVFLMGMQRAEIRESGMGRILLRFAVVFLATWAGGLWLTPFGPEVGGFFWLPFVAMALLVALLIAAATPRRPSTHVVEEGSGEQLQQASRIALGVFFWVLMAILALAILAGYWVR